MKFIYYIILVLFYLTAQASQTVDKETFRFRLIADPKTFDWTLVHTSVETPILMNIMEGLVGFDANMKIKPLLAQSWAVSDDKKTYTFKLRPGVQWSDGKPLVSHDFIYSWKRLLDPNTAAPYAYLLYDIEGAQDFNAKKTQNFESVGIKAIDNLTIQIKLKQPVSYFIQLLSFWAVFPSRQDLVEKFGKNWSNPENIQVVGPFIPVKYQPQTQIIFKRNERYYGKKPFLKNVIAQIINEDTSALALFKNGQLDYTRPINGLEIGDLQKQSVFHVSPYYRTCYLQFVVTKFPFNLPAFRKAVASAVDRSMMSKVLHEPVTSAASFVYPSILPEAKSIELPYLGAKALDALKKDTGIDPSTLATVDFMAYGSDQNALITQFIQNQLKRNLNLKVQIQMPEYSTYRTQLELKAAPLFYRCWGADYADPYSYLSLFLSDAGNNRTGWKNEKYDQLVRRAAATSDINQRNELNKQALELIQKQDVVILPLFYDTLSYLLQKNVKGFQLNPLAYFYLKDVTIE